MTHLISHFKMYLWLTFLTGIAYPLLITGIGQLILKEKANGGFIGQEKSIVGATLIGQKFESDSFFWSRPSAVNYNPLPSGASNLSITNPDLKKMVEARKAVFKKYHQETELVVPSEFLFASASGLDPHITPQGAIFQIERILKARNWDEKKAKKPILDLIEQLTEKPVMGFLGEPHINVLKLNLALNNLKITPENSVKP